MLHHEKSALVIHRGEGVSKNTPIDTYKPAAIVNMRFFRLSLNSPASSR